MKKFWSFLENSQSHFFHFITLIQMIWIEYLNIIIIFYLFFFWNEIIELIIIKQFFVLIHVPENACFSPLRKNSDSTRLDSTRLDSARFDSIRFGVLPQNFGFFCWIICFELSWKSSVEFSTRLSCSPTVVAIVVEHYFPELCSCSALRPVGSRS